MDSSALSLIFTHHSSINHTHWWTPSHPKLLSVSGLPELPPPRPPNHIRLHVTHKMPFGAALETVLFIPFPAYDEGIDAFATLIGFSEPLLFFTWADVALGSRVTKLGVSLDRESVWNLSLRLSRNKFPRRSPAHIAQVQHNTPNVVQWLAPREVIATAKWTERAVSLAIYASGRGVPSGVEDTFRVVCTLCLAIPERPTPPLAAHLYNLLAQGSWLPGSLSAHLAQLARTHFGCQAVGVNWGRGVALVKGGSYQVLHLPDDAPPTYGLGEGIITNQDGNVWVDGNRMLEDDMLWVAHNTRPPLPTWDEDRPPLSSAEMRAVQGLSQVLYVSRINPLELEKKREELGVEKFDSQLLTHKYCVRFYNSFAWW